MLQVFLKFVYQYLLMVSWAMEKLWGTLHFSSFISYTGAPAKKFPGLFSFIFLFVLLVYRAQTCPVGTDTKGRLYPTRGDSPLPSPPLLVARSLIPQPTEDGGRSVKVLWDGAYGFFISLRGIEWLSNHSWASVESLSHQWVTLTANGRLRLRISQNRKWADKNSLKQFSWKKVTWNTFLYGRTV